MEPPEANPMCKKGGNKVMELVFPPHLNCQVCSQCGFHLSYSVFDIGYGISVLERGISNTSQMLK